MVSQFEKVDSLVQHCLENAYVDGLIQNLIEMVILSVIYFYFIGYYTNVENLKYFVAVYFLVTVLLIPVDVIHGARNLLIKGLMELEGISPAGKWVIAETNTQKDKSSCGVKSPWQITMPGGLTVGVTGALIAYFIVSLYNDSVYIFWIAVIAVSLAAFVATTISIHINFKHYAQSLCNAFFEQKPLNKQTIDDYVLEEHILPWCFILGILSLLLSFKTCSEYLYMGTDIPVSNLAFSTGSTCYVMMMWMWHASQQQIRADAMLGRIHIDGDTSLSSSDAIFLIHVAAAIVVGLGYLVGFVFGLSTYTLIQAMAFHLIMVLGSCAVGNVLGIIWGIDNCG